MDFRESNVIYELSQLNYVIRLWFKLYSSLYKWNTSVSNNFYNNTNFIHVFHMPNILSTDFSYRNRGQVAQFKEKTNINIPFFDLFIKATLHKATQLPTPNWPHSFTNSNEFTCHSLEQNLFNISIFQFDSKDQM